MFSTVPVWAYLKLSYDHSRMVLAESTNESDRPNEDEDATLDSRISLKRKRNPDDLINLESLDHDEFNLNFLSPALKRRILG